MKVFIKNEEIAKLLHSEDTKKIITYLESIGKICVKPHTIEWLYGEFSNKYYSAGWMYVSLEILEEFANWLEELEL